MNCSEQPEWYHCCWFFSREQSHRELLTAFLLEGLEKGEKIIYITDINSAAKITGYLKKAGLDLGKILAGRPLEILSSHDTYFNQGYFDSNRMIALLREKNDQFLVEGYTGLRVTSEMTWILRKIEGTGQLFAYEALINDCFKNRNFFYSLPV